MGNADAANWVELRGRSHNCSRTGGGRRDRRDRGDADAAPLAVD
jgi:hypothetical protein